MAVPGQAPLKLRCENPRRLETGQENFSGQANCMGRKKTGQLEPLPLTIKRAGVYLVGSTRDGPPARTQLPPGKRQTGWPDDSLLASASAGRDVCHGGGDGRGDCLPLPVGGAALGSQATCAKCPACRRCPAVGRFRRRSCRRSWPFAAFAVGGTSRGTFSTTGCACSPARLAALESRRGPPARGFPARRRW